MCLRDFSWRISYNAGKEAGEEMYALIDFLINLIDFISIFGYNKTYNFASMYTDLNKDQEAKIEY